MANLSGTPKYTLTITSDDASVPNLVLSENDVTEFNKVRVTLTSLEITKQMYEPCKIEALIQFMDGDKKNADSMDSNMATIDSLSKLLGKKVELTDGVDKDPIAKDYVLCDFEPELRPSNDATNLYVKLSIYSPEKLLTYTKGNSCYVAKKLGDVFKNIADEANIDKNVNLQNIVAGETKQEFVQPYMVQFEETQVDFLSRMANRCGEFLFFEDGKWQLGTNASVEPTEISKYESLSFRQFTAQNQNIYSISNYAKAKEIQKQENEDNEKANEEKDAELKKFKESDEYKNLSDKDKKAKEVEWNNKYDEEHDDSDKTPKLQYAGPSDEFLYPVNKKDSDAFWDSFANTKYWIKNVPKWLKQDNLTKMIEQALADLAEESIMGGIHGNDDASEYNKKFYDKFVTEAENKAGKPAYPLSCDFATNQFTSNFYCGIEEKEKESEKQKIHVNLGTNYTSLCLGETIKINGKLYLITQILNVMKVDKVNANVFTSYLEIEAVSVSENKKSYPCPLPGGTIRKSEPQLAIVTSVEDPLKIGRIQIKYPWQIEEEGFSSPWIRISAACATDGGGIKFMPQEDDEIMVGYENGNIERPYMIGSLATTATKGASNDYMLQSPNGQYIKFDNSSITGSDLLGTFVPAYNMVTSYMPSSSVPELGEISKYGGGVEIGDKLGFYKVSMSTADRSINISSTWGDVSINAFTGISINSPNGDIEIKGKNVTISAGNELTLKSGTNASKKRAAEYGLRGVLSYGISTVTNKVLDMTVGQLKIDLSMLRMMYDCIFKPVGGTMLIKSSRFMRLEAGKGKTELPMGVATNEENDEKRIKGIIAYNTIAAAMNTFDSIISKTKATAVAIISYQHEYEKYLKDLDDKIKSKKTEEELQYNGTKYEKNITKEADFSFQNILKDCLDDKNYKVETAMSNLDQLSLVDPSNNNTESKAFNQVKTKIKCSLDMIIAKIHDQPNIEANDIKNIIDNCEPHYKTSSSLFKAGNMTDDNINKMKGWIKEVFTNNKDKFKIKDLLENKLNSDKIKILKRQIAYDILQKLKEETIILISEKQGVLANLFDDAPHIKYNLKVSACDNTKEWINFLECIKVYDEDEDEELNKKKSKGAKAWDVIKAGLNYITDWEDTWDSWEDSWVLDPKVKGEILMSDSSGNTININGTTIQADSTSLIDKLTSELKGI